TASVESPGGAPVRLRDLGSLAGADTLRVAQRGTDQRSGSLLGWPSARRAHAHHGELGPNRSAPDRSVAADARKVAIRRLPAVLDQRRLRAPRRPGAATAGLTPRLPRLVGGHRLWISLAFTHPDCGCLRIGGAEWRNGLGLRRGLPRHAQSTQRPEHRDRGRGSRRHALALWRRVARTDGRVDRTGENGDHFLGPNTARAVAAWFTGRGRQARVDRPLSLPTGDKRLR